jgi:hypothetical protein
MTYCCQNEGKKANRTTTGLSRVTVCVSKIVASNAVGLLLNYFLEQPSNTTPGRWSRLGFRRV